MPMSSSLGVWRSAWVSSESILLYASISLPRKILQVLSCSFKALSSWKVSGMVSFVLDFRLEIVVSGIVVTKR